jgi:hypothetical protein
MGMQNFRSGSEDSVLTHVKEGMKVFDRSGDQVGEVDMVHFGEVGDTQAALGTGPAEPAEDVNDRLGEGTFVDIASNLFGPDDTMEETVRNRLLQHGFVRVDVSGIFTGDRYVMPEQIASVSNDEVHLSISKDDLAKID